MYILTEITRTLRHLAYKLRNLFLVNDKQPETLNPLFIHERLRQKLQKQVKLSILFVFCPYHSLFRHNQIGRFLLFRQPEKPSAK